MNGADIYWSGPYPAFCRRTKLIKASVLLHRVKIYIDYYDPELPGYWSFNHYEFTFGGERFKISRSMGYNLYYAPTEYYLNCGWSCNLERFMERFKKDYFEGKVVNFALASKTR